MVFEMIGAWTICSPVPVLACRPLESSGGLVYGGTPSYYDDQLWPDVHRSAAARRRQSQDFWLKTKRKENITD